MKYLNQNYLIKMASNDKQRLQDKLILNQYMCSLFRKNIKSIEGFQSFLADGDLEGIDEKTSRIRFTTILETQCPNMINWLKTKLDIYDQNIQEYLEHINFKREKPIQLKYYQYLAILFNEIFLDRYYNERENFIDDLYDFSDKFNENKQERDWVEFDENNLSKITFWSSTGSGKTFFIHINYLQALKYIKSSEHQIDNILLITPNESLSKQHIEEFEMSNIPAKTFENRNLLNYGDDLNTIKVIEITKLTKEKKGNGDGKTIQLEQFGEHNIIFVDEGHRGSSGKEWKENREAIKGKGFMFEYSATFGQVANSDPLLFKEYARSIIFDYSYRYFHMDGFGKDYSIFNLEQTKQDYSKEYLVGSLLSFYEQKLHYNREKDKLKYFNLDSPLMLYVGSKVNTQENSDILEVIKSFIFILNKREDVIKLIENNLDPRKSNLLNNSNPIFQDKFPLLKELISSRDLTYESLYDEILDSIFNKRTSKILELHDLKKSDGEIGLKVGDLFFGVINVGDIKAFLKLVREKLDEELVKIEENNFQDSLFFSLDSSEHINFLIGSKKFMEGWNSFRVSQICLLNIGKSEGSQVIQLFGRGVRLRGYNGLLKRTTYLALNHSIPEHIEVPTNIEINETLNIFGLNAKYISEFKEILEKEGIREYEEMTIPIDIDNFPKNYKLYIPKIPSNIVDEFNKESILISKNEKYRLKTSLDLRSKIEILESERDGGNGIQRDNHYQEKEMKFPRELIEFINFDKVFLEVSKYKEIKKLNHIYFEKVELRRILEEEEISIFGNESLLELNKEIDSIEKLDKITDYAIQIIKSYVFKFYNKEKSNYFKDKFEYEELLDNYENEHFFPKEYVLTYERNTNKANIDFSVIKKLIDNNKIYSEELSLAPFQLHGKNIFKSLVIPEHIYKPLLFKDENDQNFKNLKISPTPLVESEKGFVKDLTKYLEKKAKELGITKLFLLRNPPRKGVGFFESKNFYPDFIMWIQKDKKDYITFIDPKGLIYVDQDDEKLELSQRIKDVESDLNEKHKKSFTLNSFILSITPFEKIRKINKKINSQKELEDKHILFLEDKNSTQHYYLDKMFNYILSQTGSNIETKIDISYESPMTFTEKAKKVKKS